MESSGQAGRPDSGRTANDTLLCQGGSLPVGQVFQMKVHTVPDPSPGMGGQVYARRAGVLEGPFSATGP